MKVVLDASIVIDYLWTKRRPGKADFLFDGVISIVTLAELYSGKSVQAGGGQLESLKTVAGRWEVVIPNLNTALEVGKLRSKYQLSLGDAFVAQLALEKRLPLATMDKKAFLRIEGIKFYSFSTQR